MNISRDETPRRPLSSLSTVKAVKKSRMRRHLVAKDGNRQRGHATGLVLKFGPPRARVSVASAVLKVLRKKTARRRRTPQAPRKARCTQPRRVGEPTGQHVPHTCIPQRTTPRAHRRRTQSRTPHRHRRPHTDRQPLVHPRPLVPKPSLGP